MPNLHARWRAPIVVRLVVLVLIAMSAVSLLGGAFVFWRVDSALNAQLDQDVRAYRDVGVRSLNDGDTIPIVGNFGYQIFSDSGQLLKGDLQGQIASPTAVARTRTSGEQMGESGGIFSDSSYIWIATPVRYLGHRVVVVFAVNRREHDDALRELLAQLAIAGGATLIAAGWIGYRTARAALDPVERYRIAAETADHNTRLPVGERRDEVSRLGHTFNAFLDRLEDSRERERRFLADASHELRAPLSVMRAEVEVALMRAKTSGEVDPETLRSLGTQIGRLERLSNALLELEELTSSVEAVGQQVFVEDLLADAVDQARSLPGCIGRTLRVAAGEPLTISAHPYWLEVAVNNLLTNAIRYGEGAIEVGARQTDDHGRVVEIWVSDQGAGLPRSFLPRAFDRFARVDESRASGGTGLGLSIVAEIADLHGGSVSIDGARVALLLPQPDAPGR